MILNHEPAYCLKVSPSGESYERIDLFLKNHGLISCLKRISKKKASTHLDLFDLLKVETEKAKQGNTWFLKSSDLIKRRSSIGKDYRRMGSAAKLSTFLQKNLSHLEDFDDTWNLTEQVLNAFEKKPQPTAALFKGLYLFAKKEGYPVKEEWWNQQKSPQFQITKTLILCPLDQLDLSETESEKALQSLFTYFKQNTAIIPD